MGPQQQVQFLAGPLAHCSRFAAVRHPLPHTVSLRPAPVPVRAAHRHLCTRRALLIIGPCQQLAIYCCPSRAGSFSNFSLAQTSTTTTTKAPLIENSRKQVASLCPRPLNARRSSLVAPSSSRAARAGVCGGQLHSPPSRPPFSGRLFNFGLNTGHNQNNFSPQNGAEWPLARSE